MNAVSTKYNQADAVISFVLQVPQGDRFEIEVKQSQYNFYLNETIVQQIQQAKQTNRTLYIPPSLLITLWYYTCINHNVVPEKGNKVQHLNRFTKRQPILIFYTIIIFDILKLILSKSFREKIILQTEFTFNSYYSQDQSAAIKAKDEELVLQSTIFLNGDVFHKIKKDFLEINSQLSIVVSAHYWLTEQVLSYFRTNFNILIWEIASLVPAGFLANNLYPKNWILLIVTWLVAAIVLATIRLVIVGQMQRRSVINSKYLNYLVWELTCLIPAINVASTNGFQALLMMVLSPLVPPILKRFLAFIWPKVGKLMMRRLLSS